MTARQSDFEWWFMEVPRVLILRWHLTAKVAANNRPNQMIPAIALVLNDAERQPAAATLVIRRRLSYSG
jgi:hypothetical protein